MKLPCPKCGEEIDQAEVGTALDPMAWQAECERAVLALVSLLRLAGRHIAASAVIELLRTLPRSMEEQFGLEDATLFSRCVHEAIKTERPYAGPPLHVVTGSLAHLVEMPEARRKMLDASIVGGILGWGMGM